MELLQAIQMISKLERQADSPTDLVVGTVTKTAPLEIRADISQASLQEEVLYLTESVIEKKLVYTYSTSGIRCVENGKDLPVTENEVILNRGLQVGDKVLLLEVQHGQQFIVLSRIF